MKILIPAKTNSTRVPDKNWRPITADGRCIIDILVDKVISLGDVWISCEDESKRDRVQAMGATFLLRPDIDTDNDTPMGKVIANMVEQIPGDADIFYCQATNPFFNEHAQMLALWHNSKVMGRGSHDSVVAVHPFKDYILGPNMQPIGFGFGKWHVPSQQLSDLYKLTFCASIFKRETVQEAEYHFGPNAYYYPAHGRAFEIDTINDFNEAGRLLNRHV